MKNQPAISGNAIRVVKKLRQHGYEAYIVGGAVRDIVLGLEPKDFDIATSATPEQIRKIMRNTRKIGRRFKLVHAYFADEIIEISTFRKLTSEVVTDESGRLIYDNVFGTAEEDAWRRDFTANALFLDPSSKEIIDHTGGLEDLEKRRLRIIGDPDERYCEDPVRMVRAVRLASKLSLELEKATHDAITRNLDKLDNVPRARLFDELTKIIKSGQCRQCFLKMESLNMIASFFPHYKDIPRQGKEWIEAAMMMSDRRQHKGETVSVSIFIASLYWPTLEADYALLRDGEKPRIGKFIDLFKASEIHSCPLFGKRTSLSVTEMWETMARIEIASRRKQVFSLRYHPALRLALAFIRLRAEFDESLLPVVMKWDEISECNHEDLEETVARLFPQIHGPSSRRRKKRAKP